MYSVTMSWTKKSAWDLWFNMNNVLALLAGTDPGSFTRLILKKSATSLDQLACPLSFAFSLLSTWNALDHALEPMLHKQVVEDVECNAQRSEDLENDDHNKIIKLKDQLCRLSLQFCDKLIVAMLFLKSTLTLGGRCFFMTCTDDFSDYMDLKRFFYSVRFISAPRKYGDSTG